MIKDKPFLTPIRKIIQETVKIKTFYFDNIFPEAKPGQFVMVWIPGHDELPFGIIVARNKLIISVAAIGAATKALHTLKIGDEVGLRGPYGSYFQVPTNAKKIALIAGGYGVVPLMFLAETVQEKVKVDLFLGVRTAKDLLFMDWLKKMRLTLNISTNDGSIGYQGFNTDLFALHIQKGKYDYAASVGPEIMEYKVAQICYKEKIPFEVSIERYMKCGLGICGSCCVDSSGWRMCVEGPVINGKNLKKITEFGKYHRSGSGKIEYFPWVTK